ncbi:MULTISPECIES: MATE family efflux transporter [Bacillaceae]|uniref:MATE family efflux transporter n=1 Tax=Evansella alkalicola TaxID=745819 RepID=A0ABS6JYM5_9BACI|nr:MULTISPECIES: MATE family efflux transporter [Bacillaceae]MBU9723698.1 MATE family efflux transporter [Bacillus alkalicola]
MKKQDQYNHSLSEIDGSAQSEETKATLQKISLFAITWPILIEVSLQTLMQFVDVFMLSFVSDEAVAAIGVVNQILIISIVLFNFAAMGCGVVVAQFVGARKPKDVSATIANAMFMNLLFGVVISGILIFFREPLLGIFDLTPELLEYANIYMLIVGGSMFIQAMVITIFSVLQAQGNTKDVMYVSIGMNILNIIGNYLFIFGALGVPQLGVMGVAISTAACRLLAMLVLFYLLYKRVEVKIKIREYFMLKGEYVKKILKIGIPGAGEHLSHNASQLLITVFITILGTVALSTRVYTLNYAWVITTFSMAMSKGMQIYIGQLVGAGLTNYAYKRMFRGLRISLLVAVSGAIILAVFGEFFLGLFTSDQEIIAIGAILLIIGVFIEPGRTTNMVVISALRAAGDARYPVIVGIISMWGISVTLAYFLGIYLGWGLIGVWIALLADEWIRAILMLFRWRSRKWQSMGLVEDEKGEEARSSA